MTTSPPPASDRSVWLVGLTVALLGLLATAIGHRWVKEDEQERVKAGFERRAEAVTAAVQSQLSLMDELTLGLALKLELRPTMTHARFKNIAAGILSRHPEIQAIERVARVSGNARREFEGLGQLQSPDFQFTEKQADGTLVPAGIRDEYLPILNAEPLDTILEALGYDLAVGPTVPALIKARDSGSLVASHPIRLVQEQADQAGIVLIAPVYDHNLPQDTVEQRQQSLLGYAQIVLRVGNFLEQIVPPETQLEVTLEMHDLTAGSEGSLLYSSNPAPTPPGSDREQSMSHVVTLKVADRSWSVRLAPTAWLVEARSGPFVAGAWPIGLAITTLATAFAIELSRRRVKVESLVRKRTSQLNAANQQLHLEAAKRARAQTALLASEDRYRRLAESSIQGVIVHREDEVLYANPSALEMFGFSKLEEFQGRKLVAEHAREQFRKELFDRQRACLAGETLPNHAGWEALRKDGSRFWVRTHAVRLDWDGAPAVAHALIDITDQRRLDRLLSHVAGETATATGNTFFESLVQRLAEAFETKIAMIAVVTDPTATRAQTLAAWAGESLLANFDYDLKGTPCDEVVGQQVCVHPEGVTAKFPSDTMLTEMGVESYVGVPLHDTTGNPLGLVVLMDDHPLHLSEQGLGTLKLVSARAGAELERLRQETALQASELSFRTLIEEAPDAILLVDHEGNITLVNHLAQTLFGYTQAELLGQKVERLMPATNRQRHATQRTEFLHEGQRRPMAAGRTDLSGLRKDGTEFPVDISLSPIATPHGRVVMATIRDLTKQRAEEKEKQQLDQRLRESQKLESLGVLAGGIAHDFNNLLTAILGNASLARMELPPTGPAQESLEQIERSSQRAAELCRQMLAYAGRGRFILKSIDLSHLAEDTADLLQMSISKKAVVRFNLTRNLPPVRIDPTQLRQVIMNLVMNASDAIGEKSGIITLTTGLVRADADYLAPTTTADPKMPPGDYVFLEVSDTGCGMADDIKERIFDPFFSTKFTGRGLGLAATQGIVRSHGGAIKVYTEPGRGSTFKILLPANNGSTSEKVATLKPEPAWQGTGTVLVVDDEETLRATAARILERLGFSVLLAVDGREGVRIFLENQSLVKLVLLDLTMPHMDGEQTYHELQRINPQVPVLLMSGFTEDEALNRFAGKGVAGFQQKPFNLKSLGDKIRQVLEEADAKYGPKPNA